MDPNHYHYQQAMFNFMQNYQNPNPQNSQIPPMPPFSTQVPPFSTQVPPFSTQVGTENEERVVVKKKSREQFTRDEDILLIQSWLNVSKDPIVGVDQKAESFWVRVAANYNQYRGESREKLREKLKGQLKCRWHRINGLVQKFVGCYKQAVNGKKSGTSENDVMAAANAFFAQDQGTTFNLEYAWRLLKDEPKWMGESIESSSKITKTYASEASSENPNTPSSYEFNSSSPMERPMGQKAAKRKGKAKEIPNETQDARNKRSMLMERLAQSKEDEIELKVVQLMMKDTSTMSDSQRDIHEKYCNKMKKKYGM
ncbi:glutathione S-transferase T3-like [Vicia villosa]|uniref:glutathione S-transferase T3-like n=1 Tax=Vicia villosa TaxID=3911 RepID=UPI00273B6652|nr:glutathione S-transferase T3-like [Vicia villosa]